MSKLSVLIRRVLVVGKNRLRKSFYSKKEGWDVKKIRCATCLRWLDGYNWDGLTEQDLRFCSWSCELEYINAEEEDIVY